MENGLLRGSSNGMLNLGVIILNRQNLKGLFCLLRAVVMVAACVNTVLVGERSGSGMRCTQSQLF